MLRCLTAPRFNEIRLLLLVCFLDRLAEDMDARLAASLRAFRRSLSLLRKVSEDLRAFRLPAAFLERDFFEATRFFDLVLRWTARLRSSLR